MKKRKSSSLNYFFSLLLLFTLLFASSTLADAPTSELYDYGELTLGIHLGNQLTIVPNGDSLDVEYVIANLLWYPRDSFRQDVRNIMTNPRADFQDEMYVYRWQNPSRTQLDLTFDAIVETSNELVPVTQATAYPIKNIPPEIAIYTKPTGLIDINDDIQTQALSFAVDDDDLFSVVFAAADWVTTNIEYNLTTMTAGATQPSSWVMANREGVCDEMTALFISMLRSLGIPARFVSGISYTNLPEFAEPWGGHGWAEVWFPEVGWVPFDVTYGTYGYVDATHIKLRDTLGAESHSVDYSMRSSGGSLVTQSLDTEVEILDRQFGDTEQHFTVTLEPYDDQVGFDSYNLITATITNKMNYYVSARFTLAETENLKLFGESDSNLLLKPRETKKLHFLVKPYDLKKGYYYDFPVKLYAGFREVGTTTFQARTGFPTYDEKLFAVYTEEKEIKEPYADVELECTVTPLMVYLGETVAADCVLRNTGGRDLSSVELCLDGCQRISLKHGAEFSFTRTLECATPGTASLLATARNSMMSSHALIQYQCLDEPAVMFYNVTFPETLGFAEKGEIHFFLFRESETIPQDVTVSILHDNFDQVWTFDELMNTQEFTFTFWGESLDLKDNDVELLVEFKDALGKSYTEATTFTVAQSEFTFFEKMQVYLSNFQRWVDKTFFS